MDNAEGILQFLPNLIFIGGLLCLRGLESSKLARVTRGVYKRVTEEVFQYLKSFNGGLLCHIIRSIKSVGV